MPKPQVRCRQIARTWSLWFLIASAPRTIEELAEELGVTTRSVRRDIRALEDAGVSVYDETRDDGKKVWRTLSTQIPAGAR